MVRTFPGVGGCTGLAEEFVSMPWPIVPLLQYMHCFRGSQMTTSISTMNLPDDLLVISLANHELKDG